MVNATANIKGDLAAKAGMPPPAGTPTGKALSPLQQQAKTVQDWVEQMGPAIERALPQHVRVDKLQRAWLTEFRRNPKLMECTGESVKNAIMLSAQLGLIPGPLGHCYALPFRNNKRNISEIQFIIGYKGMIHLSRNSGQLESIRAMMVYSNDQFKLTYGIRPDLIHIPWYLREDQTFKDGGQRRGAYMVATFKDGGFHIGYLSIPQIEANHRARSKAKDSGPWVTDYDDMCCKSVVRDNWKWLPYDTELTERIMEADAEETLPPEKVPFTVEEPEALPPVDYSTGEIGTGTAEPAPAAAPQPTPAAPSTSKGPAPTPGDDFTAGTVLPDDVKGF